MKLFNQIGIVILIVVILSASGCTDSQLQSEQTASEQTSVQDAKMKS